MKFPLTIIFFFIFSLTGVSHSSAQDLFNLQEIHEAAKTLYVKPETLDRLMIRLRTVEKDIQPEQEQLLMDTYRIISEQYIANNHYSQAYQVYMSLIDFKEKAIARNFTNTILETKKSIEERRTNEGTQLMNLQNQVQQLQIDNDLLISKRLNFKKYFSFIIIALSTIFSLMLVNTALKLMRIRSTLKENREKMKSIHRIGLIGSFAKGLVNRSRQQIGKMEELANSIGIKFKELPGDNQNSLTLISNIKTNCKESIKDLNASGIEA